MQNYDIIIAGGGLAGLSLAYHIHLEPSLQHLSVLIIDKTEKSSNDRTWCFWTDQTTVYDPIIYKTWKKLSFLSTQFSKTFDLKDFSYHQIRGIDFYNWVNSALSKNENFTFHFGNIDSIKSDNTKATVKVGEEIFQARVVYDSTTELGWVKDKVKDYNLLLQHFKGWVIETKQPTFDSEVIQMFDLRIPQNNQVEFVYILPYSPTKALVEYTIFSKAVFEEEQYDLILTDYLKNTLELDNYQITETEMGVIPMTDYPFPRNNSKRIHYLGSKGGMWKGSTGYAFLRTQRDSQAIVENLKAGLFDQRLPQSPIRLRIYDAMILDIMRKKGGAIHQIFAYMFKRNPIERTLRFLDERTYFLEELLIMASVPPLPFIQAIFNLIERKQRL